MRILNLVALCLLTPALVHAQGIGLAGGYGAGGVAEALRGLSGTPTVELLIFGDTSHDVFLGCLSCAESHRDSVHNRIGTYGNPFSGKSLLNDFLKYRNQFTTVSACNEVASSPPVIVDRAGKFYGELTMNTSRPRRNAAPALTQWLGLLCAGKLD